VLATVPAVAVKLAVVAPDATITDAGTVSAALFEESPTDEPPVAAACDKVTVQIEVPPDTVADGEQTRLETVVIVAVTVAVCEVPLVVAVNVAV